MVDSAVPQPMPRPARDMTFVAAAVVGLALACIPIFVANPLEALYPHDRHYFLQEGRFFEARGLVDRAIVSYQNVLRSDPYDQKIYARLGRLYLAKGNLDNAARELGRAIHLAPDDPKPRADRGMLIVRQIDDRHAKIAPATYLRAIADLDVALRAKPDIDLHLARIRLLLELKRFDEALADYRKIDFAAPDSDKEFSATRTTTLSQVVIAMMYILHARQDFALAATWFDDAYALLPPQAALFYLRGVARQNARDFAGAVEDFKSGLVLDPGNVTMTALLSQATAALSQPIVDADQAAALQRQADERRAQGDIAEALLLYGRAIAISPPNTALYFLRGTGRMESGDRTGAAEDFRAGLALEPNNASLQALLGQIEAAPTP